MRCVKVKDQNASFTKPSTWDETRDGACGALPIRREEHGIYNSHYSNWKPSAEELALLNSGGVVELCCVGVQPPVSVGVVKQASEESDDIQKTG